MTTNPASIASSKTPLPEALQSLKAQLDASSRATAGGPPAPTSNPFFGVGPITNMTRDEVQRNALRFEFEAWLEKNYRKLDDRGRDVGPFTVGELERSMHRGYPADKIVLDMMREIHRYFGFPQTNRMAVGLGGGHNGFTVALLHLMNPSDSGQHVFIDTPRPETSAATAGGFFRQSWGAQVLELQQFARHGSVERIHFAGAEGHIPPADELSRMGIRLFVGVGHETTGATTYNDDDIHNLLAWIDQDPAAHHALIDGTSLLGAMPWPEDLVHQMLAKACFFMPFQKAVGGVAGYFAATFTPAALELIETNAKRPGWAIPRHLKLAVPKDASRPLTGEKTTALGPLYDPEADRMLGGIINTFSNVAFAETTFGILAMQKQVGSSADLNRRSLANREAIERWVEKHPLFELGVRDPSRRGAAVTLLKVVDPQVRDPAIHARIIAKAKQLLGYEGLTHANSDHEPGLDVARYINTFPGTPGDFRAWIGGVRPVEEIAALLNNLEYCYHRAKIVVLEDQLAAGGAIYAAPEAHANIGERPVTGGEAVGSALVSKAAEDADTLAELRRLSESLTAFWKAMSTAGTAARRAQLSEEYGARLVADSNRYATLMDTLGLRAPA
jgi:phosphoserine aminotransferase